MFRRRICAPTPRALLGGAATATRSIWSDMMSKAEKDTLIKLVQSEHYEPKEEGVQGQQELSKTGAAAEAARMEVFWLVEWIETFHKEKPSQEQKKMVQRAVLERIDLHKPLSYIIGTQPFYQTEILCKPPLLIPRSETEEMTRFISTSLIPKDLRNDAKTNTQQQLQPTEPYRILDVCCGTGCIGVSLALVHKNVEVLSLDVDPIAVATTKENAAFNNVSERVSSMESDMLKCCPSDRPPRTELGRECTSLPAFDLIVSNPPYILDAQYDSLPQSVKGWEGKLCLVGDGKRSASTFDYYRELMEQGHKFVARSQTATEEMTSKAGFSMSSLLGKKKIPNTHGGREPPLPGTPNIVMEVGLQAENVAEMFEASGLWDDVGLHQDMSRIPRWVTACAKPLP